MKTKLILSIFSAIVLVAILSSCQSGNGNLESNLGKTVAVNGIFVRGLSGYMIFRGEDLDSVYLIPMAKQDENSKFKSFVLQNDGRRINVTGKLLFHKSQVANRFPEETIKISPHYYYIFWDAEDTVIGQDANSASK
ncbi:MAG TPA: hypothetical protein DET40_04575 [Lentisphaeria bacterium]|nr:MAG: hypothetical protein A2X45_21545 [Lentisphaerae bacterium GWF2_50_93]HCE42801.1 hypothetical protein [Lentisphaeria bacterium]